MLEITIPGFGRLKLTHVVFDYNGTLAVDGYLIKNIVPHLNDLSKQLQIHVVTGDTFGTVKKELDGVNCQLTILSTENQAITKTEYIQKLNSQETIAIGNGRNDQNMLKEARIGIAVIGDEGAAVEAMTAADIVVTDIFRAFDLLKEPRRLVAGLRS